MKRTIQTMTIVICCLMSYLMPANADNNKPIQVKELPVKAQTVLTQHFTNQKVVLATIESGIIDKSYVASSREQPSHR